MADSGEIRTALAQRLISDSQLSVLMPDGVWYGVGKKGATRFVVFDLIDGDDEPMFGGRAFENPLFSVKAVALETTGANVKAAAARIDALLEGVTLTITGYAHVRCVRERPIDELEVDPDNADIRWLHRGGMYALTVAAL